jgi:hypothetical protein
MSLRCFLVGKKQVCATVDVLVEPLLIDMYYVIHSLKLTGALVNERERMTHALHLLFVGQQGLDMP